MNKLLHGMAVVWYAPKLFVRACRRADRAIEAGNVIDIVAALLGVVPFLIALLLSCVLWVLI